MSKQLLYCKSGIKDIVKEGEYYTGVLSDDRSSLVIQGSNGQTLSLEAQGEDGKPLPFYQSEYYKNFYIVRQLEPMVSIDTDVWLPNPEKPGYVSFSHKRTVDEIYKDIVQALKEQDVFDILDYFTIAGVRTDGSKLFPEYRLISVYLVKGGSEGHYYHIDIVMGNKAETIYLGKTLSENIDEALKVNNVLTKLFQS